MDPYDILKNKNCFLSGATGGIGREIAKELASKGCNLFLTAKSKVRLEALASEIQRVNPDIKTCWHSADLLIMDDVKKVTDAASQFLNRVDILINCAAIFEMKPLSETTMMDFESCISVNLRSAFIFSRIFSEHMKKAGWGRIVNIGSSSAYNGSVNTALYCLSKHGLLGLSRAMRQELTCQNIRVYCVSPSGTKTEMGRRIVGQNYSNFLEPNEIAKMVSFVISFDSHGIVDELQINRMIVG